MGKSEEYTEIREQYDILFFRSTPSLRHKSSETFENSRLCCFSRVYQDKLASLKKQVQQLKDGSHPEYNRKVKRLEAQYKERY